MKNFTAITLLELIITLSIAAVLALVTYGTLSDIKIGYRRKEAQTELIKLKAIIQEQAVKYSCSAIDVAIWLNTGANTGCTALPAGSAYLPIVTPNQLYTITLTNSISGSDPTVILTATPVVNGPQSRDSDCTTIVLTSTMGITDDIKSATGAHPANCWQ